MQGMITEKIWLSHAKLCIARSECPWVYFSYFIDIYSDTFYFRFCRYRYRYLWVTKATNERPTCCALCSNCFHSTFDWSIHIPYSSKLSRMYLAMLVAWSTHILPFHTILAFNRKKALCVAACSTRKISFCVSRLRLFNFWLIHAQRQTMRKRFSWNRNPNKITKRKNDRLESMDIFEIKWNAWKMFKLNTFEYLSGAILRKKKKSKMKCGILEWSSAHINSAATPFMDTVLLTQHFAAPNDWKL